MTITANDRIAFAEIDELLNVLDEKLVSKIPKSVRRIYRNNRDKDYKVVLNLDKPIQEQKLTKKTVMYLTELYLKYWSTDEGRKKVIDTLKANDEKISKEHEEEYVLTEFLKKNYDIGAEKDATECTNLVKVEKENFIQKIINKIKIFFKR